MSDGVYNAGRAGEAPDHGHIKSFVRRAGRMSEAQARYYADYAMVGFLQDVEVLRPGKF